MTAAPDPFLSPRSATGSLVRGRGGFWRRGSYDGPPMISDPDGAVLKSGDRKGEIKRHAYASASGFGNLIEDMSWTAGLTDHTAADRGTFIHKIILDHWHKGLPHEPLYLEGAALGIPGVLIDQILEAWKLMLAENGLVVDVTEQAVVNDELRAAGTIDLICHSLKPLFDGAIPIGRHVVGDIKTGQTRQAHAAQLYVGATSVPYDTDTETRGDWDEVLS